MTDSSQSDPGDGPRAPEDPARRRFLARVTAASGVCLGAAAVTAPAAMILTPLLRGGGEVEGVTVDVGPIDAFAVGAPPVRIVLRADRQDAWLSQRGVTLGSILVQRVAEEVDGNGGFLVFSAICPHLGCAVGFREDLSIFFCPCHRSAFAPDGERVAEGLDGAANPAPRGLDALDYTVTEGRRLVVEWVRYATGTADRRRIGS